MSNFTCQSKFFILIMHHYPDLGSASELLKQISHMQYNQSEALPRSPDVGSDVSSVWNFCTLFTLFMSLHREASGGVVKCWLFFFRLVILP